MAEHRHFFVDPESLSDNLFSLNGNEGHHAARVTRIKVGDSITLIDGTGPAYGALVDEVIGNRIKGHIVERIDNYHESPVEIHLGIAILKGSKLDTVVEKCTELGVTSITMINLNKSVKQNLKLDRLQAISLAAIKQCGRGLKPVISINELSDWISDSYGDKRFVLHNGLKGNPLTELTSACSASSPFWLIVGPEGGFSKDELVFLISSGFERASLGVRRLKAETAAITSVALVEQLMNGFKSG